MLQRIRTTKPEFYRHYELFDAERDSGLPLRLAFQALWTCCDREGRFPWRPEELKVLCLPYDDVDFSRVLDALTTRGFLVRYRVGTREFGCVPTFDKHQSINNREKDSEIPSPCDERSEVVDSEELRRVPHACPTRHDPAQAEREREREREREKVGGERSQATSPPRQADKAAIGIGAFPVKRSRNPADSTAIWFLPSFKLSEYEQTYGGDVLPEVKKLRQWCIDNPSKRKTDGGMQSFLTRNLNRVNDRGGFSQPRGSPALDRDDRTMQAMREFAEE